MSFIPKPKTSEFSCNTIYSSKEMTSTKDTILNEKDFCGLFCDIERSINTYTFDHSINGVLASPLNKNIFSSEDTMEIDPTFEDKVLHNQAYEPELQDKLLYGEIYGSQNLTEQCYLNLTVDPFFPSHDKCSNLRQKNDLQTTKTSTTTTSKWKKNKHLCVQTRFSFSPRYHNKPNNSKVGMKFRTDLTPRESRTPTQIAAFQSAFRLSPVQSPRLHLPHNKHISPLAKNGGELFKWIAPSTTMSPKTCRVALTDANSFKASSKDMQDLMSLLTPMSPVDLSDKRFRTDSKPVPRKRTTHSLKRIQSYSNQARNKLLSGKSPKVQDICLDPEQRYDIGHMIKTMKKEKNENKKRKKDQIVASSNDEMVVSHVTTPCVRNDGLIVMGVSMDIDLGMTPEERYISDRQAWERDDEEVLRSKGESWIIFLDTKRAKNGNKKKKKKKKKTTKLQDPYSTYFNVSKQETPIDFMCWLGSIEENELSTKQTSSTAESSKRQSYLLASYGNQMFLIRVSQEFCNGSIMKFKTSRINLPQIHTGEIRDIAVNQWKVLTGGHDGKIVVQDFEKCCSYLRDKTEICEEFIKEMVEVSTLLFEIQCKDVIGSLRWSAFEENVISWTEDGGWLRIYNLESQQFIMEKEVACATERRKDAKHPFAHEHFNKNIVIVGYANGHVEYIDRRIQRVIIDKMDQNVPVVGDIRFNKDMSQYAVFGVNEFSLWGCKDTRIGMIRKMFGHHNLEPKQGHSKEEIGSLIERNILAWKTAQSNLENGVVSCVTSGVFFPDGKNLAVCNSKGILALYQTNSRMPCIGRFH